MKRCFRACMMAFSMFCALPSPFLGWDEEARPLMTLFLPVVGAWIGFLWALSALLIRLFHIPAMLGAALLCAYPCFCGICRGVVVNFHEVAGRQEDVFLLKDGTRLPISRRRLREVQEAYSAFRFDRLRKDGVD